IVDRAIYMGVDPRLALAIMIAENPLVVMGDDVSRFSYAYRFGEVPVDAIAIEELAMRQGEALRWALSSDVPNGRPAIVGINLGIQPTHDQFMPPEVEVVPVIPGVIDTFALPTSRSFVYLVPNLDTRLSVQGNSGLLYLKLMVQDNAASDRNSGRSLAYTIQRYNGLGAYGVAENVPGLNGLDTSKDPIYGKRVIDYLENAVDGNPQLSRIIEDSSRKQNKPVVNIRNPQTIQKTTVPAIANSLPQQSAESTADQEFLKSFEKATAEAFMFIRKSDPEFYKNFRDSYTALKKSGKPVPVIRFVDYKVTGNEKDATPGYDHFARAGGEVLIPIEYKGSADKVAIFLVHELTHWQQMRMTQIPLVGLLPNNYLGKLILMNIDAFKLVEREEEAFAAEAKVKSMVKGIPEKDKWANYKLMYEVAQNELVLKMALVDLVILSGIGLVIWLLGKIIKGLIYGNAKANAGNYRGRGAVRIRQGVTYGYGFRQLQAKRKQVPVLKRVLRSITNFFGNFIPVILISVGAIAAGIFSSAAIVHAAGIDEAAIQATAPTLASSLPVDPFVAGIALAVVGLLVLAVRLGLVQKVRTVIKKIFRLTTTTSEEAKPQSTNGITRPSPLGLLDMQIMISGAPAAFITLLTMSGFMYEELLIYILAFGIGMVLIFVPILIAWRSERAAILPALSKPSVPSPRVLWFINALTQIAVIMWMIPSVVHAIVSNSSDFGILLPQPLRDVIGAYYEYLPSWLVYNSGSFFGSLALTGILFKRYAGWFNKVSSYSVLSRKRIGWLDFLIVLASTAALLIVVNFVFECIQVLRLAYMGSIGVWGKVVLFDWEDLLWASAGVGVISALLLIAYFTQPSKNKDVSRIKADNSASQIKDHNFAPITQLFAAFVSAIMLQFNAAKGFLRAFRLGYKVALYKLAKQGGIRGSPLRFILALTYPLANNHTSNQELEILRNEILTNRILTEPETTFLINQIKTHESGRTELEGLKNQFKMYRQGNEDRSSQFAIYNSSFSSRAIARRVFLKKAGFAIFCGLMTSFGSFGCTGKSGRKVVIFVIDDFNGVYTIGERIVRVIEGVCNSCEIIRLNVTNPKTDKIEFPLILDAYKEVLNYVNNNPSIPTIINIRTSHSAIDVKEYRLVKDLYMKGVVIVAPAGDLGLENPIYPAAYEEVVAVA
ncbi:MAG: hypothetical protein HY350_02245, partial [Candidatus Omnitrophica bacterium]|nr:hypothetical protein [Candidatus Omnitrophota bacterium]